MIAQEISEAINMAIEAKSFLPIWTYVLLIVLPLFGAYLGAYVKKKAEGKVLDEDFKKTLDRIEKQVNSVKAIEEQISHVYLEEREICRIKREKIELIYEYVDREVSLRSTNLSTALACMNRDTLYPTNKTQMLISLYFKDEMQRELDFYLEQRKPLITHIRKLEQANYERNNQQRSMAENMNTFDYGNQLFKSLNQARVNIELALEEQMKNLTKRSSKDAASGAA
ncbi:MAG: hypothetical protein EOO07_31730 [Chitinophagaceae bacterium]|nr:MAG: hypothetical protein EOO07_31730 [Chitinophagaceae bacterium]